LKNIAIQFCQVATILFALLLSPLLAGAHGNETGGEPLSLQERVDALEERQAEIYHTLAEKKAAGLGNKITDRISLSGLIEIEAEAEQVDQANGGSTSASDLALATVQLGLVTELTEQIHGNIVLLHEEDGATLEVDEAAIDMNFAPLFGRIGRIYVPFGVFSSHFVSDPLTLELGETSETAALVGYGHKWFSASLYVFNGDAGKLGEEDQLRDWGTSLVLTPLDGLELGGSYLSDLADSNAELVEDYQRRTGGWSAFFSYSRGAFGIFAEVLGATGAFAAADLDEDGDGFGDQPVTWNIELSWAFDLAELAARYEGSEEFAGQPARQYGIAASWSPWDHNTLSLEYLRGEYGSGFNRIDDGNLLDKRNLVTAQWAVEF